MFKCPGQDRDIKPEDVIDIKCPICGGLVDFWPLGYRERQNWVYKESIPSCVDWCPKSALEKINIRSGWSLKGRYK